VLSESLITEYTPGTGIGWHRDAPPFGILAGISFGGGCRMRFQRGEGQLRQTWTIELPPRSPLRRERRCARGVAGRQHRR
jgi:alkylated DNA repair dioxygenase AlkB